jgi:hypothetical protein
MWGVLLSLTVVPLALAAYSLLLCDTQGAAYHPQCCPMGAHTFASWADGLVRADS